MTATARDSGFLTASGLLFLASAAVTFLWCRSMPPGMPMPGGWTMSMAWMRMPGQTWLSAFGSFFGMWVLMMVAMMLPCLVPMLRCYRRSLREADGQRLDRLTAVAAAGYFAVWALLGAAVFPLGVLLGAAEMRSSSLAVRVPLATGTVLLLAGCLQASRRKQRWLTRCRDGSACLSATGDSRGAWRSGLRLGVDCSLCCSGLMTALLVGGVMDFGVMALVAVAVAGERLAPNPVWVARTVGFTVIAVGAAEIARAVLAQAGR